MRKNIFLVGIIIILGIFGYTILAVINSTKGEVVGSLENTASQFFSQLNGAPVSSATATMPAVVTIMIDNHPDARPQFGLSEADVVYEAPVEGDFTRFMAVFERDKVAAKVGPVRSARSYYLDWQAEYGSPLYMHCGGSPEALNRIKTEDIFAANEFYWGKYYWRDNNFVAPHNLFTNSEDWQKLWQDYDKKGDRVWSGWSFNNTAPTSSNAIAFTVDYGIGHKVEWQFEAALGKYGRYLKNVKQNDASGEEILADNVVVQYVKTTIVDNYGRREIQSVGSGSVRVFRDGKIVSGIWKKNSVAERTRFFDDEGNEIKLKPGKTWLQIVPIEGSVTITG